MKLLRYLFFWAFLLLSFTINGAHPQKILGVGQAIYDILHKCDEKELSFLLEGSFASKGSCHLIDDNFVAILREKIGTKETQRCAGGGLANSLAGLAKLGSTIDFFYAVADDEYGQAFNDDTLSLGIKIFPTTIEKGATGLSHAFITPDGERTMLTRKGVCSSTRIDKLSDAMLRQYDMVLSEGYMLYDPHTTKVAQETLTRASLAQKRTAFTLSSPHVVQTYKKTIFEMLEKINILFGSEKEYFELCGTDSIGDIISQMRDKVEITVMTRNIKGALIITKDEVYEVPVLQPIEIPLDSTGAGDAFVAGFIKAHLNGLNLTKAAQAGHAAAFEILQQIGARPGKTFSAEKIFGAD